MIRLNCTSCQTLLEVDDGFAGGVCRCHHCGTIQTVPRSLMGNADATDKPAKALYKGQRAQGSGLDDLADIVSSGAFAGSGLQQHMTRSQPKKTKGRSSRKSRPAWVPIAAGALIALVLLLGLGFYLTRGGGEAPPIDAGGGSGTEVRPAVAGGAEPFFLDIPLRGDLVIFLLDRGGGTANHFGGAREAVLTSAGSLGPNRRFQVVLWGDPDAIVIPTNPQPGTEEQVQSVRDRLEEISPFGQTSVDEALKAALAARPSTIVLMTGKGWDLQDDFADSVEQIIRDSGHKVTVHTVALGTADEAEGLRRVARNTGGQFSEAGDREIRRFIGF